MLALTLGGVLRSAKQSPDCTDKKRQTMKQLSCLVSFAGFLLTLNGFADAQPPGRDGFFGGGPPGERVEPEDLEFSLGVATIPDRATFEKLSYKGFDVGRDPYLANLEYVKFVIENTWEGDTKIYFMNTKTTAPIRPTCEWWELATAGSCGVP